MKPEKVLSMLNTPEDIEELKRLCEDEIRKSLALKTNSKSRVSNMGKIMKENIKNNETRFVGYRSENGKYLFTNKSILFVLNDNLGYEENPDFPRVTLNPRTNTADVDVEAVLYSIKTKENFSMDPDESFIFNYKYLDIITKVMGDCRITFDMDSRSILEFFNEDGEYVMFMGAKK